jgi:hypothetical protein
MIITRINLHIHRLVYTDPPILLTPQPPFACTQGHSQISPVLPNSLVHTQRVPVWLPISAYEQRKGHSTWDGLWILAMPGQRTAANSLEFLLSSPSHGHSPSISASSVNLGLPTHSGVWCSPTPNMQPSAGERWAARAR